MRALGYRFLWVPERWGARTQRHSRWVPGMAPGMAAGWPLGWSSHPRDHPIIAVTRVQGELSMTALATTLISSRSCHLARTREKHSGCHPHFPQPCQPQLCCLLRLGHWIYPLHWYRFSQALHQHDHVVRNSTLFPLHTCKLDGFSFPCPRNVSAYLKT